jgi:hypothetical protein
MRERLLASALKRLPRDPVVVGKILYGLCEMDARTHAFTIAAQDVKRPLQARLELRPERQAVLN